MKLNKIHEYIWEIPKEGKMNVPGMLFSSDKLIEKVKQDNTLQQVKNVACLKGIVGHSLAMADAHVGYGFCIGGVAAFDVNEGIISPGGVGYDINCLLGDSKILTSLGYYKNIREFEHDFVEVENAHSNIILKSKKSCQDVLSYDYDDKSFSSKQINFFMKKKHSGQIINIKTKLGYTLRVTKEHPILTNDGMIPAGLLKKNSSIAVNAFEGVPYDQPIEESDILGIFIFSKQQNQELEKRDVLPLTYNNPKISILAKLFGYLLGDGNMYVWKGRGRICAYGSKEDLESIKKDFAKVGFSARIYNRTRNHSIPSQYGLKEFRTEHYELHVSSSALTTLFYHLGYPKGPKPSTYFLIPQWIMDGPKWIKRLFLSGFFGAELSSPRTHTKTGFDSPIVSQNKIEKLIDNGRAFSIQMMRLLEDLGINVTKISERKEFKNKTGKTERIRLQISSQEDNLLRLWSKIGYSYNKKRDLLSQIAILYIKDKKIQTKKREQISNKIKDLKQKGLKLKEVQALLMSRDSNKNFIEKHYYYNIKATRISQNFLSFDDYKKLKMQENKKYGFFLDSIQSITKENYEGYVYDLNVDKTHNFIANNIIVSNCSVRMLKTNIPVEVFMKKQREAIDNIFRIVPTGAGRKGAMTLDKEQLRDLMSKGAKWMVDNGYGKKDDYKYTESEGKLEGDANEVSDLALQRGQPQLGSLGSGNHFVEVQAVEEIFNKDVAKTFGIDDSGNITLMIHCGSRGLGHQVASDFIRSMEKKFGFANLPDRELINAPIQSPMGQQYVKAMNAAANFAFANKQLITHNIREEFKKLFGDYNVEVLYDICHNIAKFEKHKIDGSVKEVCVHRKGATRSFGPGRKELPEKYQEAGQPVLIPGSMGTASYLLVGTEKAEEVSFASTAHGAGRVMSRNQAMRDFNKERIMKDLSDKKVYLRGASKRGIVEESPGVYKDVNEVVKVSDALGIGNLVVKVKPLGVIKG
tara:strand:- start:88 stop:3015 length:2928 start_codon:yes stop_codon:yes gene_type:complete